MSTTIQRFHSGPRYSECCVHAGTVYWNCCDRVSPRLPWSGVGDSGVGLTLSVEGISTFTRPKAWHLRQP